ncbi:hypothetical protein GFS31_36560 [Leptolyngbya sp. BL0902]|nr:hypothetical protein GFS31_36560 [Leptolyngbya sp. BL0902]
MIGSDDSLLIMSEASRRLRPLCPHFNARKADVNRPLLKCQPAVSKACASSKEK